MAKKKGSTRTTKVSLSDLMGGEGKSNADFYHGDPKRRAKHKIHRAPRDHMINSKGGAYTHQISGDVVQDMRYHELAREFINNGFRQGKAYAAVYGTSLKSASDRASTIFNSLWMRKLIWEVLCGVDGEPLNDLDKGYAIEKLLQQIETNILDYIADDGRWLNVRELKGLPVFAQQQIKKLNITNKITPLFVTDGDGNRVQEGEQHEQHVQIELWDKQKAIELLAKAMKWISTAEVDVNVNMIGADAMIAADKRINKLRRTESATIEGKAERVTTD
jgi:hypothetical protein